MRLWAIALITILATGCGAGNLSPNLTLDPAGPETTVNSASSPPSTQVFEFVLSYVLQMSGTYPPITRSVRSPEELANCMTAQALAAQGISDSNSQALQTPVESMISPMLTYLLESCSGVPSSEWSED